MTVSHFTTRPGCKVELVHYSVNFESLFFMLLLVHNDDSDYLAYIVLLIKETPNLL